MAERRVVKRTAAARSIERRDVDDGDKIEVAATVEVKNKRGLGYWPRCSVTVTVRPGESAQSAADRAGETAHGVIDGLVTDFLAD